LASLPRSRALRLTLVGLVGVAAILVPLWFFVFRDTSEPIPLEQAVASFRSGETGGVPERGAVPDTGVYVYATEGFEEIDAFLGSRHDYPPRTTITVSRGGCGLLLRWDALEGRSTTWDVCPSERGWSISAYSEEHTFFGQTERTHYVCAPGTVWRPAGDEPGTAWTRTCETEETTERTAGAVIGLETIRVRGSEIETAHLALELTLSGRTRGTGTIELWVDRASGLPVRLELTNDNRSRSAIGDVRYSEQAELRLSSLAPER
jgi:hypothetical protein